LQDSQSLFSRLSAINAAIAEGLPQEAVLSQIVESVQQLGFDRVRIDLLSVDGAFLTTVAGRGFNDNGLVPAAEDVGLARLQAEARPQIVGEFGCIPVLRGQKVIGKIEVDNALNHMALNEKRLQDALHFAHQVALVESMVPSGTSSESGNRIEELKDKLRRLERLAEAAPEMMGKLDAMSLRDRLAIIAARTAEILHAETSGVFLVDGEDLVLEASHGQSGVFEPGKVRLKVHDQKEGGLTGWIAHHGQLFNDYGENLQKRTAVAHTKPHTPSEMCYSLLAIPLKRRTGESEELVGLLRADNKQRGDGNFAPHGFDTEDEQILTIFAEAVLVAIEGAGLVNSLKEKGEFLERLIASAPDGIIAVDRQGQVTEFNTRAEEILGFSRDETLGKPVSPLYFDPKEPLRIGRKLHESPDGYLRTYLTDVRSKADERIPIHHASTWLFDANGERIGSVGYFEDLREQRALQRRESLLLKASNVLAGADRLSEGLQRLAEMMVSELGRSFCGILLMEEDEKALTLQAEYLRGDPAWKSRGQRIALCEWDGLRSLLKAGQPWFRRSKEHQGRKILEKLRSVLGFEQEIETLLVVPLKISDRVVGQLDLGNLQGEGLPDFSREETDLVSALAAQITVLIQRFQLLETTVRREKLLAALVEASLHIRPDAEMPALYKVIVRLAAELGHCVTGALYLNRPYLGQLERAAVYPDAIEERVSDHLSHEDGLIGRVAREGEITIHPDPQSEELFRDLELSQVAVVPFRRGSGEVEAVLAVGRPAGAETFRQIDLEVLDAFAAQATIALHTARLMDREQLYVRQLATLHRISDYIQEADVLDKILHSVLTGVTASYGLGFNRAILLLVDEAREHLVGKVGIGQLEEERARAAWKVDAARGLNDFERYLRLLEKGEVELTTVGKKARSLRLPIGGSDVFSKVIAAGKLQQVPPDDFERVPQRFLKMFQVTTPLAVAPLVSRGQVIGLFVVDNKFTQTPIGDDLCNALMTFASTAAVAIDNRRLFDQTRSDAEKLLSFYKMSGELVALRDPREILSKIVDQTVTAAGASWVSILLIDRAGRALAIESTSQISLDLQELLPIRPNGISMEVMRTGRAFPIESVAKMRDRVNPILMRRSVQAAICLPLSLPGKRIGTMWIHYDEPHRFPESEVAALQLHVNQAAIAYDSARRFEKLEDMRETSAALAEVDDMRSVLQRIVLGAQRVLRADDVVLWLFDAKTDYFIPENSAYAGENFEAWSDLQAQGPRQRGTAYRIMDGLWMCVEDVQDLGQNEQLGETTKDFLSKLDARGFQGVALKVGREKLGVLYTIFAKPCRSDEEERETALTFANYAALALKKAKLLDQVQRAQEAAEMVARVTLLEDPKHNLLQIAREIRDALHCGAVVLFRYNEDTGDLTLPPAMTGVLPPQEDTADYSLVMTLLERDDSYVVPDVAQDERFRESPFAQAQGIKSCVVMPLRAAERKVGIMFINYRNPRRFTADEITNVELFGNQAAVAIRNAQLLEEAATKLMKQEALADLSRELLVAESVQDTMDRVVEFAARVLDTEFCNIVLPDREGRLVFSAAVGWEKEMIGKFQVEQSEGSQTGYTIRKRMPVAVYDYATIKEFRVPAVVAQHNIHSGLSVPMFREDKVVGAMLVHTKRPRHFTEDDETLLSLIANQTAIALEGARQHEASQRKSRYLEILYEASTKVTAGSTDRDQKKILEKIVQPAMKGIVGLQGPKPEIGTIQLYYEEQDELVLESVYPPELFKEVAHQIGLRRSIRARLSRGERIGRTGRAVLTGKPQLEKDVRQNLDYVEYSPKIRSELVVPLKDHERILGVLNVESNQFAAFDKEDRDALEALAELVVVAILNTRRSKDLQTKRTLAWMGLGNAVGRHEFAGQVGALLLKTYELDHVLGETETSKARGILDEIEGQLKDLEVERPAGQAGEDLFSIRVNEDLLRRYETRIGKSYLARGVRLRIVPEAEESACIRASLQWLYPVLDTLIKNAVAAKARTVVLGSRIDSNGFRVEVYIADDGTGIPEGIRDSLLREPIEKGAQGLGVGLLIAQDIVQSYRGSIKWIAGEHVGTTMILSFPLETTSTDDTGDKHGKSSVG